MTIATGNRTEYLDCPNLATLTDFVDLRIEGPAIESLRRHVAHCTNCQQRLDELTSVASLSPRGLSELSNGSTEVQRLVAQLCQEHLHQLKPPSSRQASAIQFDSPADAKQFSALGSLGGYVIERELGHGATSTVFRGRSSSSGQLVAIKFVRSCDTQTLRRVQREAEVVRQLNHPNIVPILESKKAEDGRVFLVMPLVHGVCLSEQLKQNGLLGFDQLAKIFLDIASGLAALHQQRIIHRDLKPSNILIDEQGIAQITDFGLARSQENGDTLTETGVVVGTPAYMSPEQATEGGQVDQLSDIYSVGAALYECLTGSPPFRGNTHQILRHVLEKNPVLPHLLNEQVPKKLEAICLKAMHKVRSQRYQSAEALRDDLTRFLAGQSIRAKLPGVASRFIFWLRREPVFASSALITISVVLIGLIVSVSSWRMAESRRVLADQRFQDSIRGLSSLAEVAEQTLSGDGASLEARNRILGLVEQRLEQFTGELPDNVESLKLFCDTMRQLGAIKQSLNRPLEAQDVLANSIEAVKPFVDKHGDQRSLLEAWAFLQTELARVQIESKLLDDAQTTLAQVQVLLDGKLAAHQLLQAETNRLRGMIAFQRMDFGGSTRYLELALEDCGKALSSEPENQRLLELSATCAGQLARIQISSGDFQRAHLAIEKCIDYWSMRVSQSPADYRLQLNHINSQLVRADLFARQNRYAELVENLDTLAPVLAKFEAANPSLIAPQVCQITAEILRSHSHLAQGKFQVGQEVAGQAVDHGLKLLRAFPVDLEVWRISNQATFALITALVHQGRIEELNRLMDQVIAQAQFESQQGRLVQQNQAVVAGLRTTKAMLLTWNNQPTLAETAWKEIPESDRDDTKPDHRFFYEMFAARSSARPAGDYRTYDIGINKLEQNVRQAYATSSAQHAMGIAYAFAVSLAESDSSLDEPTRLSRMEGFRSKMQTSFERAASMGLYEVECHRNTLGTDPVVNRQLTQQDLTRLFQTGRISGSTE